MHKDQDYQRLYEAIELAQKSPPSSCSFSVGAVITDADGHVVATGFTREFGERTHAEEVAIEKAKASGQSLEGATIYSSLEPCAERLSGKETCVSKIIQCGIKKVVFALKEPPTFVNPKGADMLKTQGIDVKIIKELASLAANVNKHLE